MNNNLFISLMILSRTKINLRTSAGYTDCQTYVFIYKFVYDRYRVNKKIKLSSNALRKIKVMPLAGARWSECIEGKWIADACCFLP